MCDAAQLALPDSVQADPKSGGNPGTMHRRVYLSVPMSVQPTSDTLADPGGILVELGQSGGPHPCDRLPVTGILARQLAQAGIDIEEFADLAPSTC